MPTLYEVIADLVVNPFWNFFAALVQYISAVVALVWYVVELCKEGDLAVLGMSCWSCLPSTDRPDRLIRVQSTYRAHLYLPP